MRATTFSAGMTPILGAGAILLGACQSDRVTSPEAPAASTAAVRPAAAGPSIDERLLLQGAIDDAMTRLVPSLGDAERASQITARLKELSASLGDASSDEARRAVSRARALLEAMDASPTTAAIGLALDRAQAVLERGKPE